MYTGYIHYISNVEETRELIQELSGISLEKPIVIDDVSLLYRDTILLKFIEESNLKLILLASQDNLSTTLLSRIKTIKKFSTINKVTFEPTNMKEAQQHIDNEQLSLDETAKYLSNTNPDLLLLQKKIRTMKNKDKIIELYSLF